MSNKDEITIVGKIVGTLDTVREDGVPPDNAVLVDVSVVEHPELEVKDVRLEVLSLDADVVQRQLKMLASSFKAHFATEIARKKRGSVVGKLSGLVGLEARDENCCLDCALRSIGLLPEEPTDTVQPQVIKPVKEL